MAVWADSGRAVVASGATSITPTLSGAAPDNTHTLVVFLGVFSASVTAPGGWTLVDTQSNGSTVLYCYVKRGDGSTNSAAFTLGDTPSGGWAEIFSINGYVSLTPDLLESSNLATLNGAVGHSVDAAGSTTASNTIAFLASMLTGTATPASTFWGDWDNGFTEPGTLTNTDRLTVGVKAYTSSAQSPAAQYFFGSDRDRAGAYIVLAMQGTSADAGGDVTAPSVTVITPAAASTKTGTITLQLSATDAVGVTSAKFKIDGGSDITASFNAGTGYWEASYNTRLLSNGSHSIVGYASDAATNQGTSSSVSFTTDNDFTNPVVVLVNPDVDDLVSGTITLALSASDASGVTTARFNIDGGSNLPATYNGTTGRWEASYNTTLLSNASHTITATAIDAYDNSTTTSSRSFVVDNVSAPAEPLIPGISGLEVAGAAILRGFIGTHLVWGVAPAEAPPPDPSSYGPNGTHWYANAALEGEADNTHEVACTWSAIGTQITACAAHTGYCEIRVQPGVLAAGGGAGSSTAGVLNNIGSTSKVKRTLIRPRDGYGTVTIASTAGSGTALVGVHGVVFHKIDFSNHPTINMRNSVGLSIGYTKLRRVISTGNGGTGVVNNELVEVVLGPTQVDGVGYDRSEFKTASGYTMNGFRKAGVYVAPNYKPLDDAGHCDSIQYEAVNGGGLITNIEHEDVVMFRSADQGIQAAGPHFKLMKHSLYLGKNQTLDRYPMYIGGDPMTLDNVLNGSATVDVVEDCIVGGNIDSSWTFTTRLGTNKSEGGKTGWTTDAGMASWTTTELDALSTYPDDTYLASIWT